MLVFSVACAVAIVGGVTLIDANQLLSCFTAGVVLGWDEDLQGVMHSKFSEGVDNVLDVVIFTALVRRPIERIPSPPSFQPQKSSPLFPFPSLFFERDRAPSSPLTSGVSPTPTLPSLSRNSLFLPPSSSLSVDSRPSSSSRVGFDQSMAGARRSLSVTLGLSESALFTTLLR
jgi:hypothetical protein